MLPKEIKQVIKKHEKTIYNDIPIDEILTDLKADEVITANEVTKILNHHGHKAKNFELIQILEKKGTSDFFMLCTTLKNQEINNARELGTLLEKEAKQALNSANAMEDTNVQGKLSSILLTIDKFKAFNLMIEQRIITLLNHNN